VDVDQPLLIGVDAGATATRCVVATPDGTVLARGGAGGASQRSSGGHPAEALTAALRAALSEVEPGRVAVGVVGSAGAGAAGYAATRDAVRASWRAAGLTAEAVVVTDLEVAFAAGTPASTGLLLAAGTGAVSAAFAGGAVVRRCDGYGWLFGDEGSAVWIGLAALRAVLAALDGRAGPTALTGPVCAALTGGSGTAAGGKLTGGSGEVAAPAGRSGGPVGGIGGPAGGNDESVGGVDGLVAYGAAEARAQALVGAGYARPPADLGRLAPLVGDAAVAGDAVARGIVAEAAARLLHTLSVVRPLAAGGPVVFAGSVLLSPGPVADAVRAGVRERFGVDPVAARDGAAGAAALAISHHLGRPVPPEVHRRLTHEPDRG
jgi:N-acetylglucosamine kinase-like BadF-type ATPase